MQNTLLLAGLALILLIGAITWVIVRFVVRADPGRGARPASGSPRATSRCASRRRARTSSPPSPARSTGWPTACRARSTSSPTLSQLQQRFVSDVSHELRTPLTTIRLAGDVIYDQREAFPPATARTAELLHTQIERFDRLLSDLLEISRYDAGSVVLDAEPTNLVRLAEDCVDEMRTLAEQNGSELRLDAPGRLLRRAAWTRGASGASCATCSATRSSTARAGRSSSPSTATRAPSRSRCATTASG